MGEGFGLLIRIYPHSIQAALHHYKSTPTIVCLPETGGRVGIGVPCDYMRTEGLQQGESSRDVLILGDVIWVGCLSWWDVEVRYIELLMLRQMHFDGLDFGFADIDLLRDLYRGVSDVFMDKGDETSSLLVLSVVTVRRVVC